MDYGLLVLGIAILLMIIFHPATQLLVTTLKKKYKENKQKDEKCYHTESDCNDCMSAHGCPMKHESILKRRHNYYD